MGYQLLVCFVAYVLSIVDSEEFYQKTGQFPVATERNKPNILFILADDLGWGNVAWPGHNTENEEIHTPNIDKLVAEGLRLDRHYVYPGCSPTRASLQTGRLPIHCTENNADGLKDGRHGIPPEMSTIATALKRAGYVTSMVGKWDCGFATYDQLPTNKGYDSFYGYLSKSVGYFTKSGGNLCTNSKIPDARIDYIDLWENGAPAHSSADEVGTEYIEFTFMQRVNSILETHSKSLYKHPFFLMYSMHLPHYPSEIPKDYLSLFANDENQCQAHNEMIYPGFTDGDSFQCRSILQSQVNLMDYIIGKIIWKLKNDDLYSDTLIIFTTDNGGSLDVFDTAGNNYPLRGGKSSYFEGGIRATSFVSGGYLPEARRGQIESGLMHIADWYATLCELAGVDYGRIENEVDETVPEVDGLNLWPLLSGKVSESPRTELSISEFVLIDGNYKYIKGEREKLRVKFAIWQGVTFPNASTPSQDILEYTMLDCATDGCLFDVVNDPSEHEELSQAMPELAATMELRLGELSQTIFESEHLQNEVDSCPVGWEFESNSCGCWMAVHNYNHFVGPYQNLDHAKNQIHFRDDVDDELMFNEFKDDTEEWMKEGNYSIYLGLFVVLFVGIVAFIIKYCKVILNETPGNPLIAMPTESYGAV